MVNQVDDIVVTGYRPDYSWFDTWGSFYYGGWGNGAPRPGDMSLGGGAAAVPTNPYATKASTIAALDKAIHETGKLTKAQIDKMDGFGINLSDILRPGIYQAEFQVLLVGEHRQWVRVYEDGTAELITALPTTSGLLEVLSSEPWEDSRHGRNGDQAEQRFSVVAGTVDDAPGTDAIWNAMLNKAEELDARGLNYNGLFQNSNSAFNTVALAAVWTTTIPVGLRVKTSTSTTSA